MGAVAARIEDYAFIGDLQTGALVSRDGSIDWLCVPRFDSPACFASLLGTPENGRWQIRPDAEIREVRRRYLDGTLILETEFVCDGGSVAVIDFMPPRTSAPDLVRIVEGRRGEVPMRMELVIRCYYGSVVPWVRRTENGIRAVAGPDTIYCRSTAEMHGENLHTVARFTVKEGERVPFELVWTHTRAEEPPAQEPNDCVASTEAFWRDWSGRCSYKGRWWDAVMRSFIVLKALTYAPTGGVVAAATTSLPEKPGGVRNWDYRYCWLRDATFTLYALVAGGYTDEACAWRGWLVDAVAGEPSKLQIMYGLRGERRLYERVIDWLPGYEGSAPVRAGNDAYRQHQLDVYGEVMDVLHAARVAGLPPDENAWRIQRGIVSFLEGDWRKPDNGIWEVRGPQRHFTHSKVMAWVAMDRAVKSVEQFGTPGDAAKWAAVRDAIRSEVLEQGFNTKLNAFVQYYGSDQPDASLLMLPLTGFIDARDPRMIGTVKLIQDRLTYDGFLRRYENEHDVDGLPPGEGAFLLCTFWLVDNLALQGRFSEAEEIYERLVALRNDVGLLSEQYDPETKRMLGNFPQAFSHVGLINSARNLDHAGGPAEQRAGV